MKNLIFLYPVTFSITFTRSFTHNNWVDNVDRVEAGGDNGFNGRFHALEADFDAISTQFTAVETALNTLGAPPATQTRFSTAAPAFVPTSATPWSFRDGSAEKPGGATAAAGQMTFPLPHGQRITAFRAVGVSTSAGASLRVTLFRRPLTDPSATPEIVARVTSLTAPTAPAAGLELIDNEHFTYYVIAQMSGALATDTVAITGLQVTHTV